jgi:aconitase A
MAKDSREHAAMELMFLRSVESSFAKSFARIHETNLKNKVC